MFVSTEPVAGFHAPVHRALTEPILVNVGVKLCKIPV